MKEKEYSMKVFNFQNLMDIDSDYCENTQLDISNNLNNKDL